MYHLVVVVMLRRVMLLNFSMKVLWLSYLLMSTTLSASINRPDLQLTPSDLACACKLQCPDALQVASVGCELQKWNRSAEPECLCSCGCMVSKFAQHMPSYLFALQKRCPDHRKYAVGIDIAGFKWKSPNRPSVLPGRCPEDIYPLKLPSYAPAAVVKTWDCQKPHPKYRPRQYAQARARPIYEDMHMITNPFKCKCRLQCPSSEDVTRVGCTLIEQSRTRSGSCSCACECMVSNVQFFGNTQQRMLVLSRW